MYVILLWRPAHYLQIMKLPNYQRVPIYSLAITLKYFILHMAMNNLHNYSL